MIEVLRSANSIPRKIIAVGQYFADYGKLQPTETQMKTRKQWIEQEGYMGNLSHESEQAEYQQRMKAQAQVNRVIEKHGIKLTADEFGAAVKMLMQHDCDDRYASELILTQLTTAILQRIDASLPPGQR